MLEVLSIALDVAIAALSITIIIILMERRSKK